MWRKGINRDTLTEPRVYTPKMAGHGRRKAVSSAAGLKTVQQDPAHPSSRALHGGAADGGMAQPLDSAQRAGALSATGGAATVAAGAAVGHATMAPSSRSSSGEGWHQAQETGRLLAAGGVAGAVSKSATAPLARLTILYQVDYEPDMHAEHACFCVVAPARHV